MAHRSRGLMWSILGLVLIAAFVVAGGGDPSEARKRRSPPKTAAVDLPTTAEDTHILALPGIGSLDANCQDTSEFVDDELHLRVRNKTDVGLTVERYKYGGTFNTQNLPANGSTTIVHNQQPGIGSYRIMIHPSAPGVRNPQTDVVVHAKNESSHCGDGFVWAQRVS